jgi:glycosyltransferase involved in cell wall biosynthesis
MHRRRHLHVGRRIDELRTGCRQGRGEFGVVDSESPGGCGNRSRKPSEPRRRPDDVRHRFHSSTLPAFPGFGSTIGIAYDERALEDLKEKRIGVYIDVVYNVVEAPRGARISTDRSFLLFVECVGESFAKLVLFGRATQSAADAEYVLSDAIELVPLPHYQNLRRLSEVARAAIGTIAGLWRGIERVDVVWVFGPHPFAAVAALFGVVRGKQVVLGVRQFSVRLYRVRVEGWKKRPAVAAMWLLDGVFRLLARRVQVAAQGSELAARYGAPRRANVHTMTESVIRQEDVAHAPAERDWSGTIELLTVGRLETEKNPLLVVEMLARLEHDHPARYRLTWVGRGPLEEAVLRRASELDVRRLITLIGYVRFGQELLDLYRQTHIFVHVSLSEGMPKVLIEALACGTPLVATDVGGVRDALAGGSVGVLVPPGDVDALVSAVERVTNDAPLRRLNVARGLELARSMTLEAEAERVVRFIAAGSGRRPPSRSYGAEESSRAT